MVYLFKVMFLSNGQYFAVSKSFDMNLLISKELNNLGIIYLKLSEISWKSVSIKC